MSDSDVLKMKVADLKRELKVRGLSTAGNKNELQERLQTALLDGDLALDDPAISEDLLDEALTDEDDKEALELSNEDAVLQSPDKEEEKNLEDPSPTQQQKKVILKRKNSITVAPSTVSSSPTDPATSTEVPPAEKLFKLTTDIEPPTSDTESKDVDGKKVVKLSQLSNKDRLEMRAKKFGISTVAGTETAKLARAERFGQTATKSDGTAAASNGTTVVPATSIDVLKKRAERFGGSVSSRMTDLEKKEKLAKRQERFGAGATTSGGSSSTTATVPEANGASATSDYTEKAKQRLERFKTAVK